MSICCIVLAWLLALIGPPLWRAAGLHPEIWLPHVPNVTRNPSLYGTLTDVTSSVGYLLWIAMFIVACCVPLEFAKFHAHRPVAYVSLTILEGILALDIMRSYCSDWWVYLLGVARIVPMDELSGDMISLTKIGLWPWFSGLVSVAVIFVVYRQTLRSSLPSAVASDIDSRTLRESDTL